MFLFKLFHQEYRKKTFFQKILKRIHNWYNNNKKKKILGTANQNTAYKRIIKRNDYDD